MSDVKRLMGDWKSSQYKAFENLWDRCFESQFNKKFKPSATCYKSNIGITEYILEGNGNKTQKKIEFDGLIVLTDDHKPVIYNTGNRTPLIINLEYTIKQGSTSNALDYWTHEHKAGEGKLIKLMKFMDTKGKKGERKERLKRLSEKYSTIFPNEEEFQIAYLIGIDRYREISLSKHVSEIQNFVDKAFPARSAKVSEISGTGGIQVEMDDFKIIASVLNLGQCADHLSTINTLEKNLNQTNGMKKLFFERGLFELSQKVAGQSYSLISGEMETEIPVTVLSNKPPHKTTNRHTAKVTTLHGVNVETYRLRLRLRDLLRLCCVERTLNDVGALQRLPEPSHLKMIATEGIAQEKEFVNPIVISTTQDFIVERDSKTNQDYIKPSGLKKFVDYYTWALIDGQHRVFSGYIVDLISPKLSNVEFDAVIRVLDSTKIPEKMRNDINADTFFDLNYRTLQPKAAIALVRSTEISAWPNGWIDYKPRLMIYSSRILAARFLLELNKEGPFKNRFGYGGSKFGSGQITLDSPTTYLGGTYNHFDFYFRYTRKGTPDSHKNSIGSVYAKWGIKSSKGTLVFPDNKEWQTIYPYPTGLDDDVKVGETCRELEKREFWSNTAKDFNQFLNEIIKNFNPSKHQFKNSKGIPVDWSDAKDCLYITKNSGIIPALVGTWFAYIKKHGPPSHNKSKHAVKKNYDPRIGSALAAFYEDKIHANNPKISGVSTNGGLFTNSDGDDCKHNYSSAAGMKLLREDFIAVINNAMTWSGTTEEIIF